jgi:O-antigen/teichoic acid export membrane protein
LLLTAVGLFSQIVGFGYRIALSRLVGAETMGLYQLIMPVYSTLMSLTAIGLTVAVSTLSARYSALGDRGAVRQARNRALALFFCAAIPLGALLIVCSDPISTALLGDARTQLGLMLLVPCVLLTGAENLHKHCFYGMGLVRPPAFTEAAEQLIRSGAVLGLLVWLLPRNREETVGIIVLGMILCEIFSALTLTLLFCRWWKSGPAQKPRETVRFSQILSISTPVAATSLLGTLLGSANSVLIPAKLVEGGAESSAAISSFGVLCGMTMPMLYLPTGFIGALCLVLVPNLAQKTALGERKAVREFLDKVLTATSLFMAPAMALMTVVGPSLARWAYGDPEAGNLMGPLALGTLLGCYQSVLSGALNGIGKQSAAAAGALFSDVIQLGFTYFTVAKWGLAGFVAGFILSSLAGAVFDLVFLLKQEKMRPKVTDWFLCPVLAATLMGLCANLLFRYCLDHGVTLAGACLLSAGLGIVIYLAALQAQGVLPRRWGTFTEIS